MTGPVVRILIGLVAGLLLFLLGIPVLQSVVRQTGYYADFTYEQAVLAILLILACIIVAQLTGARPPNDPGVVACLLFFRQFAFVPCILPMRRFPVSIEKNRGMVVGKARRRVEP